MAELSERQDVVNRLRERDSLSIQELTEARQSQVWTAPLEGADSESKILRRIYGPYLQGGSVPSADAVLRSARHDFPEWTPAEQSSPERIRQKEDARKQASLRSFDALIERLSD